MILKTLFVVLLALGVQAKEEMKDGKKVDLKAMATKFVSGGKIVEEDGDEFAVQTSKGTKVELELQKDGKIEEASGEKAMAGDVFTPTEGNLISLEKAADSLKKSGKMPTGEWSFEETNRHGWVYEFEGKEDNKNFDYSVSAKDGKIIRESRDLM